MIPFQPVKHLLLRQVCGLKTDAFGQCWRRQPRLDPQMHLQGEDAMLAWLQRFVPITLQSDRPEQGADLVGTLPPSLVFLAGQPHPHWTVLESGRLDVVVLGFGQRSTTLTTTSCQFR